MVKVIQQRDKCIGCGTCVAVCPDFWHMGEDGKSTLKGAKDVGGGKFELEVEDASCNKEAAASCPVQIIIIE
ncbi:MAG: ferredoxin [Candidatus Portnoybacteria bacterium CG10_big_fil_rev_8_21_14_0_10_38_18]|uniref:Ferredoxin n=1 Tax=Candidatus Portnoybacteria bacterium CG10_big_fil_rev_8_21_14_0_10_38_18 TaxID=1974813 RepID=A0A2M8KCD5_9BACT|nr:MAG: ferredoxin [Candidatus Portnoybacteria bacterium CG10_big_fil_rev_8_21_14_0_10_38_18]